MDISDIAKYQKVVALAERPGTPQERENAQKRVAEMEAEHPGIASVSRRVTAAIRQQPEPPRTGASPWGDVLGAVLGAAAKQGAERLADEMAGHLSGADRFEPLGRNHLKVVPHQCAEEQICLEIRANKKDLRKSSFREKLLDEVERRLVRE